MSKKPFEQTKILVTGGAGFIGSTFVTKALGEGFFVKNLDVLTYAANAKKASTFLNSDNYSFQQVDVRDKEAVRDALWVFRPDFVVHFAAETHVDNSINAPDVFIETNVLGTLNMLKCCYDYWKSDYCSEAFKFLHVSTDEVFGSLGAKGSFSETSCYAPSSPYSASKAAGDHLVQAWQITYGLPCIITYASNNYGPNQFPEKLVPKVIEMAIQKKAIPVYGDGSNVRNWIHVCDHVDALMLVLENGQPGDHFNIGGPSEISNLDLVRKICCILDELVGVKPSHHDLITFVTDRPGHDYRYALDSTHIRRELGWYPKINFDDGLRQTVLSILSEKDITTLR